MTVEGAKWVPRQLVSVVSLAMALGQRPFSGKKHTRMGSEGSLTGDLWQVAEDLWVLVRPSLKGGRQYVTDKVDESIMEVGLGGRQRSAVGTQFKEAALRCQLCSCMTERERLLKLCTPDASITSP